MQIRNTDIEAIEVSNQTTTVIMNGKERRRRDGLRPSESSCDVISASAPPAFFVDERVGRQGLASRYDRGRRDVRVEAVAVTRSDLIAVDGLQHGYACRLHQFLLSPINGLRLLLQQAQDTQTKQ